MKTRIVHMVFCAGEDPAQSMQRTSFDEVIGIARTPAAEVRDDRSVVSQFREYSFWKCKLADPYLKRRRFLPAPGEAVFATSEYHPTLGLIFYFDPKNRHQCIVVETNGKEITRQELQLVLIVLGSVT
jgi:hypothetical protein